MPVSVKAGGAWKSLNKAFVKVGGVWKEAQVYVKAGGAWKLVSKVPRTITATNLIDYPVHVYVNGVMATTFTAPGQTLTVYDGDSVYCQTDVIDLTPNHLVDLRFWGVGNMSPNLSTSADSEITALTTGTAIISKDMEVQCLWYD